MLTIQITRSTTEMTTILILYIFHALCHFVTQNLCSHVRQYIVLLFYIIRWSEHKCVAGNIIKNSMVYCLVSVCSCFVMNLKFNILVPLRITDGAEVRLCYSGWPLYRCRTTQFEIFPPGECHRDASYSRRCKCTFPRRFQSAQIVI